MQTIDLNADLGEGFGVWKLGDDDALLEIVTSANVACGFHAGDAVTMQRVCALAKERGVHIGAQVGYRDLAGFGRREIEVPGAELRADVLYQIGALSAFGNVSYVKPHGALYNRCVWDLAQAQAVVDAVRAWHKTLPVVGLPDSALLRAATAAGLPTVAEGFADRSYTPDGRLVPRSKLGAVITDPARVAAQAVSLAKGGGLRTICIHGDTPRAVDLARSVRSALTAAGVKIKAFK